MHKYAILLALAVTAAEAWAGPEGPDAPVAPTDKLTSPLGIDFRLIPAGQYDRGHDHSGQCEELVAAFPRSITPRGFAQDERPRHRVQISRPFYFATHEVTVGQFREFVKATGYRTSGETSAEGIVGFAPRSHEEIERTGLRRLFERRREFLWRQPGFTQQDSHPVVGVSWQDAQAFCRWLSKEDGARYRLPTEAEWEYACRAGTSGWFSFGDTFRGEIHRHANVAGIELEERHPGMATRQWLLDPRRDPADDSIYTAPTGSYRPNPWGLYDLHGNVWEWCEDRYLDTCYRALVANARSVPSVNPRNDEDVADDGDWRVIRGGSWANGPILCRSAARGFFDAADGACYLGFRVLREIDGQPLPGGAR
jgi:formylglycine-generating enzyme required for sulfatase activity